MKIEPKDAHVKHIVNTASAMMAAARTAPKAHGYDRLECVALTGEEKPFFIGKNLHDRRLTFRKTANK